MKKIAVIGCGGAGKSTFSRRLSAILKIPVYHLDKLYWKPGWVPMPREEWDNLIKDLVKKDKWIIDGNYGRTMDIRLNVADTVIFLNMPAYLCIYRVLKRRIIYRGRSRPDMGAGCPEKTDFTFLKWILQYKRNNKPAILRQLNELPPQKDVIILNKSKEMDEFLQILRK